MRLVLNRAYGGFMLPQVIADTLGVSVWENSTLVRTNNILIDWVLENSSDLKVIEIPKKATDYIINDYDGFETILYVVDGKIHRV